MRTFKIVTFLGLSLLSLMSMGIGYSIDYIQVLIMKLHGDPHWQKYYELLSPYQKELFDIEDTKLKITLQDVKKVDKKETQKEIVKQIIQHINKEEKGDTFYQLYLSPPKEDVQIKKYFAIPVRELPPGLQNVPITISGIDFCYVHGDVCNSEYQNAKYILLDQYTEKIIVKKVEDNNKKREDTVLSYATNEDEVFRGTIQEKIKDIKNKWLQKSKIDLDTTLDEGNELLISFDIKRDGYLVFKFKAEDTNKIIKAFAKLGIVSHFMLEMSNTFTGEETDHFELGGKGNYTLLIQKKGEYIIFKNKDGEIYKKIKVGTKPTRLENIEMKDVKIKDIKKANNEVEARKYGDSFILKNKVDKDLRDIPVRLDLHSMVDNILLNGDPLKFCYEIKEGCVENPRGKEIKAVWVRVPYIPANGEVRLDLLNQEGNSNTYLTHLSNHIITYTKTLIKDNVPQENPNKQVDISKVLETNSVISFNYKSSDFDKAVLYSKMNPIKITFMDNILEIKPKYSNDQKIIEILFNRNPLDVIYLKENKIDLKGNIKVVHKKGMKYIYYNGKFALVEPVKKKIFFVKDLVVKNNLKTLNVDYLEGLKQNISISSNTTIKAINKDYNYYQIIHVLKGNLNKIEPKDKQVLQKIKEELGVYLK